jgi:putative inorganic carbon (HCO3(-)) transporter
VNASAGQAIGLFCGLGGAAVAILARDPRLRLGALAVALVAAPALIAGQVWETPRLANLRDHPALAAGAAVLILAGIAALAATFRRWPWAFPVAAVVTLPLRVPLAIGGQTSSLLVPLYGVIAAGAGAAIWTFVTSREAADHDDDGRIQLLRRLLAATLVLYAIQALYSADVQNAVENAAFFFIPFAVLFVLLLELDWSRELVRGCLLAIGAVSLVCAVIGIWEYAARDLILNQDLRAENSLHVYYRVNSIFRDPNIFGRYLALTIVAVAGYLAWETRAARAAGAFAGSAVLLIALAFSFSLTSFAALLAGLLVLVWARLGTRWAGGSVGAAFVAGLVYLAAFGSAGTEVSSGGAGRTSLIHGGLTLAGERPIWGHGSGSFGEAFYTKFGPAKTTTSHDTPITVAAEQGAVGVILYAALIVTALMVLFAGGVRGSPAGATAAALFVAMLVHTLGYASFLEDPATWAILALGIGLARAAPPPAPALV